MLLHKGFNHEHSQKTPKLHFGESFTLRGKKMSPTLLHHQQPVPLTQGRMDSWIHGGIQPFTLPCGKRATFLQSVTLSSFW